MRHNKNIGLFLLYTWLGFLFLPTLAEAGGFHITIIGSRRNGMLTNLAKPGDVTALFHNPSGLADLPGKRFQLFASVTFLENEFKLQALDPERFPEVNPKNCSETTTPCPWPIGTDGYYEQAIEPESTFGALPFLGFSSDLTFIHPSLDNLVFAIATYAPNFYGGRLPMDAPTAYFMTRGFFAVVAVTGGVGWRINKYISVGFNLSYNYMRLIFEQKMSFVDTLTPVGESPSVEGNVAQMAFGDILLSFDGVDHGMGWNASVTVNPLDWLAIGIVYSGNLSAQFEGDLKLKPLGEDAPDSEGMGELIQMFGYKLPHSLTLEMPIPPSIQIGVNFSIADWMEIGLDYRLWLYSIYERQTLTPIYDPLEPGKEPITTDTLSKQKHYRNSYEIALGFLIRPLPQHPGLEFMTGVGYDESPIPNATFTLDNPSLSTVLVSAGMRWRIHDHWRLAFTYLFLYYLKRDIRNSQTNPPTNVKGSGLTHIPGFEVEYLF